MPGIMFCLEGNLAVQKVQKIFLVLKTYRESLSLTLKHLVNHVFFEWFFYFLIL